MTVQKVGDVQEGPGMLIRFIWMLVIGWWLSGLFYFVGAVLTLFIIPAPLGMVIIQKIGWAFSLYKESSLIYVSDGQTTMVMQKQQTSFIVRFIYFIFIGWWIGGFALGLAWILGITIIGLPISFMIMNRLGKIMTLAT
jgi:uncharacterized membrane protein YccF (DUF307 family)